MQRKFTLALVVLMASMLLVAGISCARDQQAREMEVMLRGALNQDNQFVDESGKAYELVINDKTAKLLEMPQQVIEIKGTVMEKEGQRTLNITEIIAANP